MTSLGPGTLPSLGRAVEVPRYDRSTVRAGIVHLGVGGFHRAHQAMYVDALLNVDRATDWGIHGVGLLPSDAGMRDALGAQDNLYTLVTKPNDGRWHARVIGSLVGYSYAPDDPQAVIDTLSDPAIRIVTITVTEGGYHLDPITGAFQAGDAVVQADLRADTVPRSMFGIVVEALARRRALGVAAFAVVSCDNMPGNGHVAREAFTAFARLRDPALASWIDDQVRFPNSMVDRITPQTTAADKAELARRFGVEDRWPVLCEPYVQWVLEDDFGSGRPPLDEVGVQLVSDVEPYELMKLRMLNASHQALAYPGRLVGYEFVHEVVDDPVFAGFLLDYLRQEAIPTLRPVPGVDVQHYAEQLIERFANPEVRDTLARLCANTSDLIPKFLLPVIRAQRAAGRSILRSTAVIACWARYAEGVDERGNPYRVEDPLESGLRAAAARQAGDPRAFLDGNRNLFGELVDDEVFTVLYVDLLRSIRGRGVRATLADLARLDEQP